MIICTIMKDTVEISEVEMVDRSFEDIEKGKVQEI